MLLSSLLLTPILGVLAILINRDNGVSLRNIKFIALATSILNFFISLIIFILFDFSTNQFQFVQEYHEISYFDFYLGVDGLSIYFILLTTIIIPISLVSNWKSITKDVESYVIIILLLETLLLAVFLVLDILLFYIFFESILPPLFILIGIFGSDNRVKASFYLFLYTLTQQCKRAKHRENPKTLVTKVVREILLPAWLMTQGMVKSLEMISVFTLKWTTAVLSHPFIIKGVKEQRVDGSSKFRNLNFVRCTLIAGKPVFGRTIHSFSHNSRKMFIHTMSNIHNNDNNTLAHPWFVTGLTDAEGTFALGFYKSNDYRMGYQIQAIFKIAMHKKDYDVLDAIQKFFGLGKITKHGDTTLQYTVKSLADLQVIISHFDKYPLMSEKRGDFKLFKDGFELLKTKAHLNREGFHKILSIKAAINLGLSDELRLSFPDIKAVNKPLVQNRDIINPNWLAGITSGDGCFYVSLRNSLTTVSGKSVVLKFQIVQHSRDIELIKWLISTLKCGRVELDLKQSAVYFVVTNFKDIFEKIIPLFDKHKIKGVKSWDYEDFKKIAMLINDKKHLSEQGLSNIKSIKSNMNLNRKV